ncbi:MAG TPA: porin [Vicinamibacterales bacterium]|nr:porin [Vicinamibacterales bacterium]
MKKGTEHLFLAALALMASAVAPAQAQDTGVIWDRRPTFVLGETSRIEIHARVQSDYLVRDEADPEATSLGFEDRLSLPRKRVGVEGVLFDRVTFQVEGEVGDDTPWRDVFADVKVHRALRVRAGQFKVPFSLEQLTSGTDLDFIARAAAVTDLSPSREIGFMLHGRVADKAIKYEAGVFEVDATSRLWTAGAVRTLAGRVTVAPLADGKSRGSDALEISAALLRSDQPEGRGGLNGHLVMGETFFRPMFVNGTRTRMGASVAWNGTRASLRGELIRSLDTRLGQGIDNGDLSDLVSTGGYVAGIWHLAARDGRRWGQAPLRGLDLTGRFDRLSFGSAAQSGEAFLNPRADRVAPIGKDAWTAGVNWYVNRWVKVQANTVREQIVDPLSLLPIGAAPLWSTVVRFQVAM